MTVLSQFWATLPASLTTAQKLAQLNATLVAGPPRDVPVSSVLGYLMLNNKLVGLQSYAASPPAGASPGAVVVAKELIAGFAFPSFTGFQMSNPTIYSQVSASLQALASDTLTGITSADVTALLNLAATTVPWWEANGYSGPITAAYLTAENPPLV